MFIGIEKCVWVINGVKYFKENFIIMLKENLSS